MALESKIVWNGDKKKNDINSGTIRALLRSQNIVRSTAVALVPVDTGNLRGSIVSVLDKDKLESVVSTNSVYAAWIEFGDKSTSYQGQPYMRPALNDNIDKIRKIFIDEEAKSVNN